MAVATKAFFDMTYDKNTTEAILFGDACYNVSGPMAEISRQWGMFQLSYGDTDPVLSDRDKYPNFFRIVPSDSDFNPARLALLRHFNWSIVGTLFQDASHGSARYGYAHNRFDSLAESSKINITKVESFSDDPSTAIQNLKSRDVRIIVGNFDENMARRVFCSARQMGMYGPRHQWIILGTYSRDWWRRHDNRVPCTPQELNETLHGYLSTDILPLSSDEEQTESGRTPEEYRQLYERERGTEFSVYHGYAYDGIWVIARALERLLAEKEEDDDDRDEEEDVDDAAQPSSLLRRLRGIGVGKALNDTNIRGVTGRVQFNNGDRLGCINILQMQGGKLVKVAEYKALTEELDFSKGEKIVWWKDDKPPKDRTVQYEELRHVSTPVYLSLVILASTGIIMAVCFLGLNIHFRRHRFIKMSSPNMNNVIIVGCILCYCSIMLLGTDGSLASTSPDFFRYWCRARAWVLALGFTLAFGAMFSKTWRVHAIFTNIKLNRKVIKDYKLILVVMVLVMLDVALLVAWQVVDPFQRAEKRLVPEVYEDYEVIPKLEFCSSRHMEIWMGSIYAYKGLLLAFGCFLAWETRQVSIPALNDSKYIGMSVYNVVIMCTCGAAVTFLIQDQPTHSFLIIAVFILFATTATLCLVFVPKIIQLRRDPKGDDKRIRATLRKPSRRYSDEVSDHFQHKVRLAAEENRRLRGFLEQKAAEMDQLLEQLGEEPCNHELNIKSVLHKKVLALRTSSDNSPSKTSRASTQSDVDLMSTYSDVSSATTTLYVTDSPPGTRPLKARFLNSRMRAESIELVDIRGNSRRKSSVTIPPQAEDEDDDDDPFGGVYLGPPDPPPVRKKPSVDLFPPRNPICRSQAVADSTSCNNTSQHEPPTLGLTSSVLTDTGETQDIGDLLKPWQEEDGELHYSKTPSVLLLQAGQQSRFATPSGRQSRVNRRASAPISIWTIAEVGEEDHAPKLAGGFVSEENQHPAVRVESNVADYPGNMAGHQNETVITGCATLPEKQSAEGDHSNMQTYLGEWDDAKTPTVSLHKEHAFDLSPDDGLAIPSKNNDTTLHDYLTLNKNQTQTQDHITVGEQSDVRTGETSVLQELHLSHISACDRQDDPKLELTPNNKWEGLPEPSVGLSGNPDCVIVDQTTVGGHCPGVVVPKDTQTELGREVEVSSEDHKDTFDTATNTLGKHQEPVLLEDPNCEKTWSLEYHTVQKSEQKVSDRDGVKELFLTDTPNNRKDSEPGDDPDNPTQKCMHIFDHFPPHTGKAAEDQTSGEILMVSEAKLNEENSQKRDIDRFAVRDCETIAQSRRSFVAETDILTGVDDHEQSNGRCLLDENKPESVSVDQRNQQDIIWETIAPPGVNCEEQQPTVQLNMMQFPMAAQSPETSSDRQMAADDSNQDSNQDTFYHTHSDHSQIPVQSKHAQTRSDTEVYRISSTGEKTYFQDDFTKDGKVSASYTLPAAQTQQLTVETPDQSSDGDNHVQCVSYNQSANPQPEENTEMGSDSVLGGTSTSHLLALTTSVTEDVFQTPIPGDGEEDTVHEDHRIVHTTEKENSETAVDCGEPLPDWSGVLSTSLDSTQNCGRWQCVLDVYDPSSSSLEGETPSVELFSEPFTSRHCDSSSNSKLSQNVVSQISKGMLVSKSYVRGDSDDVCCDVVKDSDSFQSEPTEKKSGKVCSSSGTGGSAQVYPEQTADSSYQVQSSHGSEEELWACPASVTPPLPATSSPRVTFTCDIIEKL